MGGKLQWPVLLLLPGEATRRPAVSWVVSPILSHLPWWMCSERARERERACLIPIYRMLWLEGVRVIAMATVGW